MSPLEGTLQQDGAWQKCVLLCFSKNRIGEGGCMRSASLGCMDRPVLDPRATSPLGMTRGGRRVDTQVFGSFKAEPIIF